MSYTLTYRPGVPRDIELLNSPLRRRVDKAILSLMNDPRPTGSRKLAGATRTWRIRVGDWRIVYEIDDRKRGVEVQIVAHRREVYRGL